MTTWKSGDILQFIGKMGEKYKDYHLMIKVINILPGYGGIRGQILESNREYEFGISRRVGEIHNFNDPFYSWKKLNGIERAILRLKDV